MEFTKEAWENAPEGARLEWRYAVEGWKEVHFVGTTLAGALVIQEGDSIRTVTEFYLRIALPKRKVTVQLWRDCNGYEFSACTGTNYSASHTLLGEHTFEIEGE